jgi:hypothetical protein
MAPILGIFASQISGHLFPWTTSDYESISTVTVGSGGQTSITFTSIPNTYKHLEIRGVAQVGTGSGSDRMRVTVNGDTGSNYYQHQIYGTGSAAAASSQGLSTSMLLGAIPGSSSTNIFGASVFEILDYASTSKYKTFKVLSGSDQNDTNGLIYLQSGVWNSTSAITSITLGYNGSTNFNQYSTFALYGIKG